MYLNDEKISESAVLSYRQALWNSCPNHVVIDDLFREEKLGEIMDVLQRDESWETQKHTYSALYVDDEEWQKSADDERFVKRDLWQAKEADSTLAKDFLKFLRGKSFMSLLSRIFQVEITDVTVGEPEINSRYFRLAGDDFVEQHADDSPGREICMLLYLNKDWHEEAGGEIVFIGKGEKNIRIAPFFNRCVLFDPSSEGAEHWVEKLKTQEPGLFRYNVTSWYWSE